MVSFCEHGVEPSGSKKMFGNFSVTATGSFSRKTYLHGSS
jgi:hypothetical protein